VSGNAAHANIAAGPASARPAPIILLTFATTCHELAGESSETRMGITRMSIPGAMNDAKFLRARAQQALDVANRISDSQAEKQLRALAAEYIAAAEKLEAHPSK